MLDITLQWAAQLAYFHIGPTSEAVQEDIDPSSEMEIIKMRFSDKVCSCYTNLLLPWWRRFNTEVNQTHEIDLKKQVPKEWFESMIASICKRDDGCRGSNYRKISSTVVSTELPTCIILRQVSNIRVCCTCENQAGFQPGRGCAGHIFALQKS